MEGILASRFDYLLRIWQLRHFWFSLVRNDLNSRYKRSFLGIGWSLLRPLSMTFIYCMVFGKLFNVNFEEYAPFLLIGMTTWQFFTETVLQGCNAFAFGSAYIRQQQLPLAIFPLRTVLAAGFHSLVGLIMAAAVTWFFKGYLNPLAMLNVIPGFLVVLLLGWCLAVLSAVMHTHFPDTQHLAEIGLQIVFYLTPILYPLEALANRGRLLLVLEWNPFTSVLAMIRTPILDGTAPALHHVAVSLAFLAALGTLAILLLRKVERTLIFWL